MSWGGHILGLRGRHGSNCPCKAALPQRDWVQRLARLCTQCVRTRGDATQSATLIWFGMSQHKSPLFSANSVAESELPVAPI
jgi:hypothetical protein